MPVFFLLLLFLLLRFGLLAQLDPSALGRAARFAPMYGLERLAYWVYQLSTAALFLLSFFCPVRAEGWPLIPGALLYLSGLGLCALSLRDFARPAPQGFCSGGVYLLSRNPMYLSYFLCFLGCALLSRSLILLGVVLLFQVSAHWVILAEERWCREQFGDAYRAYQKEVRRYLSLPRRKTPPQPKC